MLAISVYKALKNAIANDCTMRETIVLHAPATAENILISLNRKTSPVIEPDKATKFSSEC